MASKAVESLRKRLLLLVLSLGCIATGYWLLNRLGFVMGIQDIPDVLCWNGCNDPIRTVHRTVGKETFINDDQPLSTLLPQQDLDKGQVSILIEKSKYKLTVFYDGQPIKTYPVVFGANPTEDKRREGDLKTPEGIFQIQDLYPHPQWSKFIWLNYPTPQSWRKHFQGKLKGEISPWATIGSEIGIHGVPQGADNLIEQRSNWTWGCISLKNDDVDEIYQFLRQGNLVEILP